MNKVEDTDSMRGLAKEQGWVPEKCKLSGELITMLMGMDKDPCVGCNYNKSECGGR